VDWRCDRRIVLPCDKISKRYTYHPHKIVTASTFPSTDAQPSTKVTAIKGADDSVDGLGYEYPDEHAVVLEKEGRPRQKPSRRCSVTKYSLEGFQQLLAKQGCRHYDSSFSVSNLSFNSSSHSSEEEMTSGNSGHTKGQLAWHMQKLGISPKRANLLE